MRGSEKKQVPVVRMEDDKNHLELNFYAACLKKINETDFKNCPDQVLKGFAAELGNKANQGIQSDLLLPASFAVVREASRRILGLWPYDVQILAGIALHKERLVEMQTGEGKTLAAVAPAFLNALYKKGVHILTFNDYLAKRDALWMGPVYEFLGLSVGYIQEEMSPDARKKAYQADITYVTAKEAGFDYLRDQRCFELQGRVHRGYHYAIVDEADSILIDEARIPLVIAGNTQDREDRTKRAAAIISTLVATDYELDEYERNVTLSEAGLKRVEASLGGINLYEEQNYEWLTLINCALHARVLLKRDVDYIIRDNQIELVDEFTGRVAEKRHWPDGLQEAVEAREGINSGQRGRILDTITVANYMGLYTKLSGMTATAQTSRDEFISLYKRDIVQIPTHHPCIRVDEPDLIFTHRRAKEQALVKEISLVHATGRPILIGTSSIEESERLSGLLKEKGIQYRVLNAKNDEIEAELIAQAGDLGAVTVSTNMAGRGTDIRLGGKNERRRDDVVGLGGLYVIGTNRHESRRIDNQLRGRAGRQGDPGTTRFFISLEDPLFKRFGLINALPEKYRELRQDSPIDEKVFAQSIEHIQRVIEGQNLEIRKNLTKYNYILEHQRRIISEQKDALLLGKGSILRSHPRYQSLQKLYGEEVMQRVEREIVLYHLNEGWAYYLDEVSAIREGIHLTGFAGKNPMDEFHMTIIPLFNEHLQTTNKAIIRCFEEADITEKGIDLEKEGLKGPSSTWTYLVEDNPFGSDGMFIHFVKKTGTLALTLFKRMLASPGKLIKRLFAYKG
ncbi:MAG: accessory Sec system translocase SecA2 [Thermoclostridium sp.]|nr:accessory Sec system translocase SecA2 [Thermoclostridium sp.]